MRVCICIILLSITWTLKAQDNIPYEDKANYKFELDYNFKNKTIGSKDDVRLTYQNTYRNSLLPYVKVLLTLTNLPEDRYKVRITNDLGSKVLIKKIKPNMQIVVDMGYADDIKDGIGAHRYDIYFEDKSKKKLSKIVLDIDKEGAFFVNEEQYGKI